MELVFWQLSLGFNSTGAVLPPLLILRATNVATGFGNVSDSEDDATARVAGVAGRFIRAEARRSQIANSYRPAGFEMKHLRRLLQCRGRTTDRPFSIVFGSLGKVDHGDAEGIRYRLWQRANRLWREEPQRR